MRARRCWLEAQKRSFLVVFEAFGARHEVSVPLKHERSGHAEFLAMQWLLERLEVTMEARAEFYVTHYPCLSCRSAQQRSFSSLVSNNVFR